MFIILAVCVINELLLGTTAHVLPNSRSCNPFIRCFIYRFCPQNYAPVCGSDGVTYDNECHLARANCLRGDLGKPITKAYEGKCGDDQVDPKCTNYRACIEIYSPVCGSDNKTYSNECYLNQANCQRPRNTPPITLAYKAECQEKCLIICNKIYSPLCGSDNQTYSNECVLSVANCKRGTDEPLITQSYKGECKKEDNCPDACIQLYDPVCGSDGKTYSNNCFLGIANCRRGKTEPAITQVYKGRCREQKECPRFCTLQYDPVCGSDGQTYSNSCFLSIASCESENSGGAPITEAFKGDCVASGRM